ncbi:AsnC family transcriptional regulator [Actibacterium mucosum KCTC 23349]|uniref:AsnC family transcriptional regulator n=2 Tax=Actibacterium TaxID=1433986 RepID=A0A037ZKM1_9RHOB|nr:AsnC family transcriptional regulator [Actibacterium mucosum KCTC 23349]
MNKTIAHPAKMDETDRRIIDALQRDGRLSNVELANRVGLSPTPCLRRVRRLEETGAITGYRAELGRAAVGLTLTVFVEITVTRHTRGNADEVEAALANVPGLVACHMVSGNADFLAEMAVADLPAYERVLTNHILTIPAVDNVRSNFALRPVRAAQPLQVAAHHID